MLLQNMNTLIYKRFACALDVLSHQSYENILKRIKIMFLNLDPTQWLINYSCFDNDKISKMITVYFENPKIYDNRIC